MASLAFAHTHVATGHSHSPSAECTRSARISRLHAPFSTVADGPPIKSVCRAPLSMTAAASRHGHTANARSTRSHQARRAHTPHAIGHASRHSARTRSADRIISPRSHSPVAGHARAHAPGPRPLCSPEVHGSVHAHCAPHRESSTVRQCELMPCGWPRAPLHSCRTFVDVGVAVVSHIQSSPRCAQRLAAACCFFAFGGATPPSVRQRPGCPLLRRQP